MTDAQQRRFEEAARQLGADEDEAAFKEKLAAIARVNAKDVPVPEGALPGAKKGE